MYYDGYFQQKLPNPFHVEENFPRESTGGIRDVNDALSDKLVIVHTKYILNVVLYILKNLRILAN